MTTSNARIVGFRFVSYGRISYYDAGERVLRIGDRVNVNGEDGICWATVAIAPGQVIYSDLRGELPKAPDLDVI